MNDRRNSVTQVQVKLDACRIEDVPTTELLRKYSMPRDPLGGWTTKVSDCRRCLASSMIESDTELAEEGSGKNFVVMHGPGASQCQVAGSPYGKVLPYS